MKKAINLIVAVLSITAIFLASNYAIAGSGFSAKKYESALTKYFKANAGAKAKFLKMIDEGETKLSSKRFTRADVVKFVDRSKLKGDIQPLMKLTIADWKKDKSKVDDADIELLEKIIKSSKKVISK